MAASSSATPSREIAAELQAEIEEAWAYMEAAGFKIEELIGTTDRIGIRFSVVLITILLIGGSQSSINGLIKAKKKHMKEK